MDLVRSGFALLVLMLAPTARPTMAAVDVETALDRWQPLIAEAAHRFAIPAPWIRAVMRLESAGQAFTDGRPTTSSAGAMGLMQVMPATYAELRERYALGRDPYDPRDNIYAGAAYLSELYKRYGWPALFAAYHAGPERFEAYLSNGKPLPNQTRKYLAALTPERSTSNRPLGHVASVETTFVPLPHTIQPAESERDSLSDDRLFVRLRFASRATNEHASERGHVAAEVFYARDP